ncbi:MAG TPA: ABC transporter ATP-binding protein [Acidimicrobiia bacterium]|nr:ABC transporter ATP-binding protein [Acidimicrobiia bacterium]
MPSRKHAEPAAPPLLEVREVRVSFGGIHALSDATLVADRGMVTGLIGPNGAGKTTLFNAITGLHPPDGGRVLLDGEDIADVKPHKRSRMGIARTFQRLEVFGSLTARENVLVAGEIWKRWSGNKEVDVDAQADRLIERVGLAHLANTRVDAMPTGPARLVEMARALATNPRLMLMDEPGSGLNEEETDEFAHLLVDLAEEGLAILLVEHDVELVMRVCKRIFVLDFGRMIAEGTPKDIQRNKAVQAAYLGTAA